MVYFLKQLNPASMNSPLFIPLRGNAVVIGAKNVLPWKFQQMSERHAKFYKTEDGNLFVKDLSSSTGIYVNDLKIGYTLKQLAIGDVIGFGVKTTSVENGFICILCREPLQKSNSVKKQVVMPAKVEPDIVNLSDDDNMSVIMIKSVKSLSAACPLHKSSDSLQKNTEKSFKNSNDSDDDMSVIEVNFVKPVNPVYPGIIPKNTAKSLIVPKNEMLTDPYNPIFQKTQAAVSEKQVSLHKNCRNILTKKCSVKLIKCDSKYFSWPADVKNPFLNKSNDDEYVSRYRKKRPRRISSDSSYENCEDGFSNSLPAANSNKFVMETTNQHKQICNINDTIIISDSSPENSEQSFSDALTSHAIKNSSREKSYSSKKLVRRRKKRARIISSDSSDEASDGSPNTTDYRNQNSLFKQPKEKTGSLSNSNILSDLSATKSSTKDIENGVYLNKNNFKSTIKLLSALCPSDFFVENASGNYLTSNNSNKETISSNYNSSHKTMQKAEIKEKSSKNLNDTSTVPVIESRGEDRHFDSFKVMNTYSQTDEIIDISDGDDYYDIQNVQNFAHIKTEPEDVEDPEYNEIYREIFEGSDGSEDFSNAITKNSAFENQEIESIEKITNFVNCSSQNKLPEHKSEESEESDSSFTDHESEVSPEENFLSSVKYSTLEKTVSGAKKSFGKTLLTEPKPMTYRPRYLMGRDEEYIERQKPIDICPKRKRGRPKKQEQFPNEVISLDSSVPTAKLPKKPEKPVIMKNSKMKSLLIGNDSSKRENTTFENKHSSKNNKSSNKTLTVPKSMQNWPFKETENIEDYAETGRALDFFAKRKRGRPKKRLEDERRPSSSDLQIHLPKKYHKSKEKNYVSEHPKNKVPIDSNSIKIPKNSIPSVKVRPDKFSSRMGFLTVAEVVKPPNRDKISTATKNKNDTVKDKKHQEVINSGVNGSGIKATAANLQNKVIAQLVTPENASVGNRKEKEHSKPDRSTSAHRNYQSLPIEKLKNSTSQKTSHTSVDNSKRISVSREDKLPFELSFNYIVQSLTKLKTIWLQEQRTISHPPSEVTQDVTPLPLSFTSYESYVSLFYPLIRLDIWQYMFEESKNVFSSKKMCNRFSFRVISFIYKHECIELKCESVLNDKFYFEPREGVIAVLEMKMNLFQSYSLFGFILKHKIDPLNVDLLHPCWKKIPAEYLKDAKLYTFSILIKQKELLLEPDILMKGNGICYIRSRLRLVNALRYFKDSPLLTDIIEPKLSTCDLNLSKSTSNREYTSRQMEIIQAICSEINKPYHETKITLLHGPPGTGKTHIIIGILEALFYASKYNSNLKVLVTAPSNVAIDEIGCRLIDLDERYCWRDYSVKFVRIGVEKHVHSKILPYFVDRKASEMYKKTVRSSRQKEKEVQDLRMEIYRLEREPDNLNKEIMLKSLKERCKYIKEQISLKEASYLTEMKCKYEILKESHIVLSTLSSCSLSMLCKTFQQKSGMNFSCCIVDESTQCNELEILQPLALGTSKLVLVGDEKQLPTAYSEYSKKYGFGRSMFERFCSYFESTNQPSPVLTLAEQFRMHPSICQFPSTYIYDKKLETHPDVTLMYRDFALKPYFILDIARSNDSSAENIRDCEVLVYNICKFLERAVNSFSSVGVIVPYEYQRYQCAKSLHSRFRDVEVNTVNGFQGREIDIVILYAIESKGIPATESFIGCKRRFNVALTRAKKCLIICLDSSPLMKYPHWKALIYNAQERKICFTVTSPKDIYLVLSFSVQKKK